MSDDWDFYICRVDNCPASIFVDLGIAQEAPITGFTDMAMSDFTCEHRETMASLAMLSLKH